MIKFNLDFLQKFKKTKIWIVKNEHKCDNIQPLELGKFITNEKKHSSI